MDTRSAILDAAAAEMIQQGYAAASMSSIAARLGQTKGALAHHFPAKRDFIASLAAALEEAVNASAELARRLFPDRSGHALLAFLLGLADWTARDPQVAAATYLFTDRAAPDDDLGRAAATFLARLEELIVQAQDAGALDRSVSAAEIAEYIFATNLGTAYVSLRMPAPDRRHRRRRFLLLTLGAVGLEDTPAVAQEVVAALAGDTPL
ncbi:TetR/AcrR family transcriptional regulator [Georgenia sp. H159]|uniref:TetR/AcrR family transcriptional regulator n=1 Tax=Georgenia sp. H159 TaxID=3076115 RepID=UPI002D7A1ED0|nr:TetR/AcrR family transcriptional regulator [Georgenia sp. H159]